jgi:predicted dehydrogenase
MGDVSTVAAKKSKQPKPIRVGVLGVGRGEDFMLNAAATGLELVAICDQWQEKLDEVGRKYNLATYTDFDKFLEHDMDAVVLANYFHQHAPFAIKALQAGKHVMSECAACNTLAEGVALCRAVEKSGKIYMLAENYPYTAWNQEITRRYQNGEIGRVVYAEGEYNHPGSFDWAMGISPGLKHWRNNCPCTYYCTHAMAPLMVATDTMPVRVNGFVTRLPLDSKRLRLFREQDTAGIIMVTMNNDAVFKLLQGGLAGHGVLFRIHGENGLLETSRNPAFWEYGSVRVVHNEWECKDGQAPEKVVYPQFPHWAKAAKAAGHGGGDFFTNYYFAQAIRTGQQPFLDVYRGVAMSVIGILAWKSVLNKNASYDVPDFRSEKSRKPYANDHWQPMDISDPKAPPLNSRGKRHVIPSALKEAQKVWQRIGYHGS